MLALNLPRSQTLFHYITYPVFEMPSALTLTDENATARIRISVRCSIGSSEQTPSQLVKMLAGALFPFRSYVLEAYIIVTLGGDPERLGEVPKSRLACSGRWKPFWNPIGGGRGYGISFGTGKEFDISEAL